MSDAIGLINNYPSVPIRVQCAPHRQSDFPAALIEPLLGRKAPARGPAKPKGLAFRLRVSHEYYIYEFGVSGARGGTNASDAP